MNTNISPDTSISELEIQAANGDGAAAWELGTRYRTGEGVPQDLQGAFRWYSRGAALGDREAQNDLGSMHLRGLGCAADKAEAVRWYRCSAEQGCVDAQWNLGKRYLHGDGVGIDFLAAYHWFTEAANQGHTEALCEIGTMHWLGHGVGRNLLAAADFHLAAAEMGDDVACKNLSEYRGQLQEIALSGSQMASLFLCKMHNRGHGADKSQAMTWAWARWAHTHCAPDKHQDIVEEVAGAYEFYAQYISASDRRAGEKALSALRAPKTARTRRRS